MRRNYVERSEVIARIFMMLAETSGGAVWLTAPRIAEYTGYKNVDHVRRHLWGMYHDGHVIIQYRKNGEVHERYERGMTVYVTLSVEGANFFSGQKALPLYFPDGVDQPMDIPFGGYAS